LTTQSNVATTARVNGLLNVAPVRITVGADPATKRPFAPGRRMPIAASVTWQATPRTLVSFWTPTV
jgi:hypothetical protein